MAGNKGLSIVFPEGSYDKCRVLSETAVHDLGLDVICRGLSNKEKEQSLILRTYTTTRSSGNGCWGFWTRSSS